MKLKKVVDAIITISAIMGVIIYVGAVGTMDYKVEMREYYPMYKTLLTMGVGVIMVLPAIIRRLIK